MLLPNYVDLKPNGRIVKSSQLGDKGYLENEMCFMVIEPTSEGIHIEYKTENDEFLTEEQVESILINHKKLT